MIRWGGAALLGFGPMALIAALLALGRQDYETCFNGLTPSLLSALCSESALLFHPIGFVGLVPFLALAAIWVSRSNRGLTLLLWLSLVVLAVALLMPVSSQHDCDRKGMTSFVVPLLLVFPGIIAAWIATWKSKPIGVVL